MKAKSQFKRRSTANNVEIFIPVPSDADSPKFKTTLGALKKDEIFQVPSVLQSMLRELKEQLEA